MKKATQHIATPQQFCHASSATWLKQIKNKTDKIDQLNKALAELAQLNVYPCILGYCYVINIKKDRSVTIGTNHHSIYSYLRLNQDAIQKWLLASYAFKQCSAIHFTYHLPDINLHWMSNHHQQSPRRISEPATQAIKDLYKQCPNEKTRSSLMKFLAKHGTFDNQNEKE